MEYGSIEREIYVDASPDIVFEVISTPEHLTEWFPDEAAFEPIAGRTGTFVFGEEGKDGFHLVPITVVDVDPPRSFAFRWDYQAGAVAEPDNSLLVTFELTSSGTGTLVRMVESGFRERGWEIAVLEERYADHSKGWDHQLGRMPGYVTRLVAAP